LNDVEQEAFDILRMKNKQQELTITSLLNRLMEKEESIRCLRHELLNINKIKKDREQRKS